MELERSLLLILISNSLNFWSLSRDARIFQKKSISSSFSTRSFFPMTITVSPSRILSSGLTLEITLPVLESEKLWDEHRHQIPQPLRASRSPEKPYQRNAVGPKGFEPLTARL